MLLLGGNPQRELWFRARCVAWDTFGTPTNICVWCFLLYGNSQIHQTNQLHISTCMFRGWPYFALGRWQRQCEHIYVPDTFPMKCVKRRSSKNVWCSQTVFLIGRFFSRRFVVRLCHRFSWHRGRCGFVFIVLVSFWDRFGIILGSFWGHFGVSLENYFC